MERRINNRFFRKILLIGVLSFFATVTLMGQTLQELHNAIERGMSPSSGNAQWAFNSLFAHRNNRCSSGSVFVIRLYASNNGNITAYYCENESSEYKLVCNELAKSHWRFESGVIDNSNGGGSSNQPSEGDIEVEQQKLKKKIEQQRVADQQRQLAQLEQQQKFEQDNQDLLANLEGMGQELTDPLERMANSLDLKALGLKPDYHPLADLRQVNLINEEEFKKELIDIGIDMTATFITTGATLAAGTLLTPEGALIAKPIATGAVQFCASLAHSANQGKSMKDLEVYQNALTSGAKAAGENLIGTVSGKKAIVISPVFASLKTLDEGGNWKKAAFAGVTTAGKKGIQIYVSETGESDKEIAQYNKDLATFSGIPLNSSITIFKASPLGKKTLN